MITCRTVAIGAIDIREETTSWPVISVQVGECKLHVHPPSSGYYAFEPSPGQLDAPQHLLKIAFQPFGLTFFTVDAPVAQRDFKVADVNVLIINLMSWVRVLTRQYWLGKQPRFAATQPSYELFEDGTPLHSGGSVNIFRYGRSLIRGDWESLGLNNMADTLPDAAEVTFCDGLLSIGNEDWRQALIQLASACDQEINFLVDRALLSRAPGVAEPFRKRLRYDFAAAHSEVMKELGLQPFRDFDSTAAKQINILYEFRGKAIHQKRVGRPSVSPVDFIFPVEKFFEWSKSQLKEL